MNRSVAVLPSGISLASDTKQRFLKLPHPRTGSAALFLPALRSVDDASPVDILLEVQAVNATGDRLRSWFIGDDTVVQDGKMLLLTPFDPIFLLVHILLVVGRQHGVTEQGASRRSVPYDDIFESAAETFASTSSRQTSSSTGPETPRTRSKRLRLDEDGMSGDATAQNDDADVQLYQDLRALGSLPSVRKAAESICEVQEIHADLSTYRLDDSKMYSVLRSKVTRLASEEAFAASPTLARLLAKEGVGDGTGLSAEVQLEARQRAALDLLTGFLPGEVAIQLKQLYTFPHLAEYLDRTASSSALSVDYMPGLSTPALSAGSSSASLSSLPSDRASTFGMSRKGSSSSVGGDDKSKKKKPLESNGVRQLKKASTRGMSPLTSFFQKKTPTPSPNEETPPAV